MIHQPTELKDSNKKVRMILAGFAGIGKTTLALSAPKPLHIDVDHGVERIEAKHRTPFIQPVDYQEILDDLTAENVKDFDTIVIDTGGRLVNLMGQWAIKQDIKNGKRDGTLSLQGYGAVKREFNRLGDYINLQLNKHLIIVFHSVEEKDGEDTKLRLKVEGGTRNDVWEQMDLGGFIEMQGDVRTIGFSNCERYYAKGTRGINGVWKIPTLQEGQPNDFLTRLFDKFFEQSNAEIDKADEDRKKYEKCVAEAKAIIASIVDAPTANEAKEAYKKAQHYLTSKREADAMFLEKVKECNLEWDKAKKEYIPCTK